MAQWDDAKLLIFCFLFITCCTVTRAEVPVDCCLSVFMDGTIPKAAVVDYRKQISGQGCSIDATVLVTRNGQMLCAPPNKKWVQDVEKHVDFLRKICKKNNYKNKRCHGVKH